MPAIKPLYDLVLLLDTAAEDSRRAEILAAAEDLVTKGGELVNKQDWGPRQMAFEIRHKKDADYHLLQFHATPELLSQLDRTLRITDEVVRFRIIKLAPGTPPPPDQRSEPHAAGAITASEGESAPADDATAEAPVAEESAVAVAEAPAEAAPEADVPADAAAPSGDDA